MSHSGTQRLLDLWTALPQARRIPLRSALDPAAFGRLLPQVFMLDRAEEAAHVRLAGGWIETLHGAPLKGADWLSLWQPDIRPTIHAALTQAFREARPVLLAATAADLQSVLEITVAPLRGPDGDADRVLGLYQWTAEADREAESIGPLTARLVIGVGPVGRAPLSLASIDGRRIA